MDFYFFTTVAGESGSGAEAIVITKDILIPLVTAAAPAAVALLIGGVTIYVTWRNNQNTVKVNTSAMEQSERNTLKQIQHEQNTKKMERHSVLIERITVLLTTIHLLYRNRNVQMTVYLSIKKAEILEKVKSATEDLAPVTGHRHEMEALLALLGIPIDENTAWHDYNNSAIKAGAFTFGAMYSAPPSKEKAAVKSEFQELRDALDRDYKACMEQLRAHYDGELLLERSKRAKIQ